MVDKQIILLGSIRAFFISFFFSGAQQMLLFFRISLSHPLLGAPLLWLAAFFPVWEFLFLWPRLSSTRALALFPWVCLLFLGVFLYPASFSLFLIGYFSLIVLEQNNSFALKKSFVILFFFQLFLQFFQVSSPAGHPDSFFTLFQGLILPLFWCAALFFFFKNPFLFLLHDRALPNPRS